MEHDRRRAWGRRALGVAAAITLYAIIGFFVLPPIARSQIEKATAKYLHRKSKVERVRFNPFTLAARVEGFSLDDRDGAALFKLDRLMVNLQLSGVFRRAVRFREIAIEGPHAVGRILADGRPSIADLFEKPKDEKPKEDGKPFRIIVDRLAVTRGSLEFVDESRTPRFEEAFTPLEVAIDGLTTIPDESGDHALKFSFGDGALVTWSGRQTIEPLHLEGKIEIAGVSIPRVARYALASLPLEVRDGKVDAALTYDVARGADAVLSASVADMNVAVRDLAVRPRDGNEDWLVVPRTEARGIRAAWPESRIEVGEVRIVDPRAVVWLAEDGKLNWQSAFSTAPTQDTAPSATPEAASPHPWSATIASVEISGASAHVEDRKVEPDVVAELTGVGVRLEGLSSDLSVPVKARVSARINTDAEATATGSVVVKPLAIQLDVALRDLALMPFNPYATALPGATLKGGVAGVEGKVTVSGGSPAMTFDGQATLAGLQVAGAGTDRLIACERGTAREIRMTLAPNLLRIGNVDVDGGFIDIKIDRDKNVNLSQLSAASKGAPQAARAEPSASSSGSFPVEITTIAIKGANAHFEDQSLIVPFATRIHSGKGSVRDLSTTSAAPARIKFDGRVAETGLVNVDGTMRIADPFKSSDVSVIFRGISLPDLTPYSAQFAGYAVTSGTLNLDIRYQLVDKKLIGAHHVVADNLVLGDKIEGGGGTGLPVKLGVALLKDKDGRIDLDVPVEGTVGSPEFNYSAVCWQAFTTILKNAAAAPFRALGRSLGAKEEDLELVGFVAGRSELPPSEQEKLVKLAAELAARSELELAIEGRFDPVNDVAALRQVRVEQRIDAKRVGDASLETILEALYTESFSAERLELERAKFVPPGEKPKKSKKRPASAPPNPAGFYDSLRAQLVDAEPVGEAELAELARARGAAILAVLTAPGGIELARVRALDPGPVKKKKHQGPELVASEMTLTAND